MNTQLNIYERLRRHERDVTLFGRLFVEWSRDRELRNGEAHQRLDAIEAQLARLEGRVRMTELSCRPAPMRFQGFGPSRSAVSLNIQQS
jgi:hypothetical protein